MTLGLVLASCADPVARKPLAALPNADFAEGFESWEISGDADRFRRFVDPVSGRASLTTYAGPEGSELRGSVRRWFQVPGDAVALRFLVHGGRSRVRLSDTSGAVVDEASGRSDNAQRIPVSWDLLALRGASVELAIEDDETGPWGFVSVSGFDLLRDVPGPLVDADFSDGIEGWTASGGAGAFRPFRDASIGSRMSLTTAGPGSDEVDAATGTLSQTFVVPGDALALRFFVQGGHRAFVRLGDGAREIDRASGPDTDLPLPVSWDLVPLRRQRVRLSIEDSVGDPPWGFLVVSAFDVLTESDGP